MQYTDDLTQYITNAIEMVSPWNLSDEEFVEAIHQQAQLMAGIEGYFQDEPNEHLLQQATQLPLDLH